MDRRAKCAALGIVLSALAAGAAAETLTPRYMALRSDHVEARRGPGRENQVEWIYRRRGLPMRVAQAQGEWLRVEDPGGALVWMRAGDLEERRTVYVRGDRLPTAPLKQEAREDSRTQAFVERGVVGELKACQGAWRQVQIEDRTGWMEASVLWGGDGC